MFLDEQWDVKLGDFGIARLFCYSCIMLSSHVHNQIVDHYFQFLTNVLFVKLI